MKPHDTVYDRITRLPCGSLIQHGSYNDRIYLMKAEGKAADTLPRQLISMAMENRYSKIFAKIPVDMSPQFISTGYIREAMIPGLFNGRSDGCFMGYYLNPARSLEPARDRLDEIMRLALKKNGDTIPPLDTERFKIRRCDRNDIGRMADIYRQLFPSYPFPIHDPEYLMQTMLENVDYSGAELNGKIVALSSAEQHEDSSAVEMTDFATLPELRGNGLAGNLLLHMEQAMRAKGIITAYTIARAISPGMNITFARNGYSFAGRLKNNTNISGAIESMNVWYKPL